MQTVTDFNPVSNTPCISLVMAVFNGQRYLSAALESILTQTFVDFECMLIDDGSTDGSEKIITEYSRRDPRIRVIQQDHAGLVAALNLGCSLARGKYIARLDCDDIAMPERFEQQVLHLERSPDIALLGGRIECIDEDGSFLFQMEWPDLSSGLRDYLLVDCVISHTTVMMRREIFASVGGYRDMYRDAEDYDFFLRIADSNIVDNLPVVLSKYRLHSNQVSANVYAQQVLSSLGARLATRERRARHAEPQWCSSPISREDLIRNGISPSRIDALVSRYEDNVCYYKNGWRWASLPFLTLRRSQ